ncbi:MAG TPA: pirin family protein [Anaerolineae bacterium]|nr:pirin family protein [Anaerolineae bacterium]HQI86792.1 pirin family protein [Anaerolineae bacterium]
MHKDQKTQNSGVQRTVARIVEPEPVVEGAGVKLRRSIASRALDYVDPFLLLDDFRSRNAADFVAGFPMHPHRGIETVTYLLDGLVRHRDSIGNAGDITAGDVQWMTAGRGILHEEMPQRHNGILEGFQLWVNLPAKDKMMKPRYQDVPAARIPEIDRPNGIHIRVVAGKVDGVPGPVTDIVADPLFLDVTIPPHSSFVQVIERGHTALAYVFEGAGTFGVADGGAGTDIAATQLAIFADGDLLEVQTDDAGVRFLLIAGKPLHEPVARYGPFVMNTHEEILQTLKELRAGTFPPV